MLWVIIITSVILYVLIHAWSAGVVERVVERNPEWDIPIYWFAAASLWWAYVLCTDPAHRWSGAYFSIWMGWYAFGRWTGANIHSNRVMAKSHAPFILLTGLVVIIARFLRMFITNPRRAARVSIVSIAALCAIAKKQSTNLISTVTSNLAYLPRVLMTLVTLAAKLTHQAIYWVFRSLWWLICNTYLISRALLNYIWAIGYGKASPAQTNPDTL